MPLSPQPREQNKLSPSIWKRVLHHLAYDEQPYNKGEIAPVFLHSTIQNLQNVRCVNARLAKMTMPILFARLTLHIHAFERVIALHDPLQRRLTYAQKSLERTLLPVLRYVQQLRMGNILEGETHVRASLFWQWVARIFLAHGPFPALRRVESPLTQQTTTSEQERCLAMLLYDKDNLITSLRVASGTLLTIHRRDEWNAFVNLCLLEIDIDPNDEDNGYGFRAVLDKAFALKRLVIRDPTGCTVSGDISCTGDLTTMCLDGSDWHIDRIVSILEKTRHTLQRFTMRDTIFAQNDCEVQSAFSKVYIPHLVSVDITLHTYSISAMKFGYGLGNEYYFGWDKERQGIEPLVLWINSIGMESWKHLGVFVVGEEPRRSRPLARRTC